MTEKWNQTYLAQIEHPAFAKVDERFGFSCMSGWPNALGLNKLAENMKFSRTAQTAQTAQGANGMQVAPMPQFLCESEATDSSLYYEQIIYQEKQIPTRRDSWHDLFNGTIWLSFPKSKMLLNKMHIMDIEECGVHPRTPRRNRITHFDECGAIILCNDPSFIQALAEHQWQEVFITNKERWGVDIHIELFGHATLESLLNPFIGLTAKWLALPYPIKYQDMNPEQKLNWIDNSLCEHLKQGQVFASRQGLKPLPVLGIPNWYAGEQTPEFYENTDYFRPKRAMS